MKPYGMNVYGWKRGALAAAYSQQELLALARNIEADPANQEPAGSLYLYIPTARKKLDEVTHAIGIKMAEKRAAEGNPVPCNGYSGRNSNRRR